MRAMATRLEALTAAFTAAVEGCRSQLPLGPTFDRSFSEHQTQLHNLCMDKFQLLLSMDKVLVDAGSGIINTHHLLHLTNYKIDSLGVPILLLVLSLDYECIP